MTIFDESRLGGSRIAAADTSRFAQPNPGVGSRPANAIEYVNVPEGFGVRWHLDVNGWSVGFELVRGDKP